MRLPQEDTQEQMRRAAARTTAQRGTTGKRTGGVDNGTVALAISGMTYYWLMPLMAGRRRKRRPRPDTASQT
ncbi:MAG: hypothetical protein M0R74_01245 [Dehalococcoidia bacterium]|nr:hypothetical protein [Dehalococcoidia bacterium]